MADPCPIWMLHMGSAPTPLLSCAAAFWVVPPSLVCGTAVFQVRPRRGGRRNSALEPPSGQVSPAVIIDALSCLVVVQRQVPTCVADAAAGAELSKLRNSLRPGVISRTQGTVACPSFNLVSASSHACVSHHDALPAASARAPAALTVALCSTPSSSVVWVVHA